MAKGEPLQGEERELAVGMQRGIWDRWLLGFGPSELREFTARVEMRGPVSSGLALVSHFGAATEQNAANTCFRVENGETAGRELWKEFVQK